MVYMCGRDSMWKELKKVVLVKDYSYTLDRFLDGLCFFFFFFLIHAFNNFLFLMNNPNFYLIK